MAKEKNIKIYKYGVSASDREYTVLYLIIKFVLGYGLVSCSLGYYVIELKNNIKNN